MIAVFVYGLKNKGIVQYAENDLLKFYTKNDSLNIFVYQNSIIIRISFN